MTDTEMIQYVEAYLGGEHKSHIVRPMIRAIADLVFVDLAIYLVDNAPDLAKRLKTTATVASWNESTASVPSNMLLYKQKQHTRMEYENNRDFYQVENRMKLDMVTDMTNSYYALEGETFYFLYDGEAADGTLTITYYKIPAITDIDDDMRNIFLEMLIKRLLPQIPDKPNGRPE